MSDPFPTQRAKDLPEDNGKDPWLIEQLWTASAAGILGGCPKSGKSWLALEMATAVATGTRCLGRFAVNKQGRVLVYLAEDGLPHVRERLCCLTRHRGIDIDRLDVHVITQPTIRLDQQQDRDRMQETLAETRPVFLVLDPLVRLHALDENLASDVSELLSFLRDVQRRFDLALLVVHHVRKTASPGVQAGQGLRGSSDLWAFGDSNLYLHPQREHLRLTVEHRSAPAIEPFAVRLVDDDPQSVHLEALVTELDPEVKHASRIADDILELLGRSQPMTRTQLRAALRVRNERLGHVLVCLEGEGRIEKSDRGWTLAVPWRPLDGHLEQDPRTSVPRSPYRDPWERNASPHRDHPHRNPGETEAGSAGAQPAKG